METSLKAIISRNPEIWSVGLRRSDGSLVVSTDGHAQAWPATWMEMSTETHMHAPIFQGSQRWGTVEVCYVPAESMSWIGKFMHPLVALCLFCVTGTLILFGAYLKNVLTLLIPSKVVPQGARSALDALSEGLLLLDPQGRIVMANQSFALTTGCQIDELLGKPASSLSWTYAEDKDSSGKGQPGSPAQAVAPWMDVLADGQARQGRILALHTANSDTKTFSVSASPICDDEGRRRGAIASFEDVSRLEQKKNELSSALQSLRLSSEKVREQNAVLERLATRDPLTNCHNRRSFFELFDSHWNSAQRYGHPLAAIMVDVDHFKSVNDTYGHSIGDQVLQKVAETLQQSARAADVVARYGGEEFALLLPSTNMNDATVFAERVRIALAEMKFADLSITASLGVSSLSEKPASPQELLDQADKCLYAAKRNGRNQVVRFDQLTTNLEVDEHRSTTRSGSIQTPKTIIPYPA